MGEMMHDMDRLQDWLTTVPAGPGVGEVSFADWIAAPVNWVFLVVGFLTLFSAVRVVTAKNVIHAALFLVAALGGTAGMFLMLSAEFVAWVAGPGLHRGGHRPLPLRDHDHPRSDRA